MKKKQLIAVALVLGVGALVYFTGGMKKKESVEEEGIVSYKCDGAKSFSLHSVDNDTVRLQGYGGAGIALNKNITGYWVSADQKTTVKTVGTYVVLVQNDKVTHDRCAAI